MLFPTQSLPRVSLHEDADVAQHLRSDNPEKEVTIA